MSLHSAAENREWLNSLHKRSASAAVLLETTDGRLLIVKSSYKTHWSIPGGVIDPRETPLEAAVRETAEEVGVDLQPKNMRFVYVASRSSVVADTYQFVFTAPLAQAEIDNIKLQASEIDQFILVTKADVARGERHYGKAIRNWADGTVGYVEQVLKNYHQE